MKQLAGSTKVNPKHLLNIRDRVSLIGAMNTDQVNRLSQHLTVQWFTRNEKIFQKGDKPSDIFIVYRGEVALYNEAANQPNQVQKLKQGDCFGESALIGIQNQVLSAQTTEKTQLFILSREALLQLFEHDKILFAILMMNLAREVSRDLHNVLSQQSRHQTEERLSKIS
ncbi:MAG: hypothetical protein COA42_20380 [Alteromonadaceae bacterium]|nr:MAG: hypothetical protein COA42_20380 [Alteromonadaceae bacterium]